MQNNTNGVIKPDYSSAEYKKHVDYNARKKTKVIIRKFRNGGDVIAIFPELPGTNAWWKDCESYQTIGQHGTCSADIFPVTTRCTEEEAQKMLKELEGLGYNLERITRFNNSHVTARKLAVQRVA